MGLEIVRALLSRRKGGCRNQHINRTVIALTDAFNGPELARRVGSSVINIVEMAVIALGKKMAQQESDAFGVAPSVLSKVENKRVRSAQKR